jgi:hypothetical protein
MIAYTDSEKGGPADRQSRPVHVVSTRRLEGETEFNASAEK